MATEGLFDTGLVATSWFDDGLKIAGWFDSSLIENAASGAITGTLAAIEAGADDVSSDENGHTIICAFENLGEVSSALEQSLGEAESVKTIWRPQTMTPVDEERAQSVIKLIDRLEDDDDVQNVYANFEVDEAVLAKLSA